jgi:hypothetical protein
MQSFTKDFVLPLQCSPDDMETRPGDMVRLYLNPVYGLTTPVVAVVQHPIERIYMVDATTGCRANGYRYTFLYDEAQLNDALDEIAECDVINLECVTCCELFGEQLAAETASRIAADIVETAARIADDTDETAARIAADNAESAARIAADIAETAARIAADTNLQGQINTEVAERIAGDVAVLDNADSRYVRFDVEQGLDLALREQAQDNIFPQVATGNSIALLNPGGSNDDINITTDQSYTDAEVSLVTSTGVPAQITTEVVVIGGTTLAIVTGDKYNMQISADLFNAGSSTTIAVAYAGDYDSKPYYVANDTPSIGEAVTVRWEAATSQWIIYTGVPGASLPAFSAFESGYPTVFPDEIPAGDWIAGPSGIGSFPVIVEGKPATATQAVEIFNATVGAGTFAEIPLGGNGSAFLQATSAAFLPVMGPPPSGTFESADNKLITVYRGVIVSIEPIIP